jgi:hypothetical protein
VRTAKENRKRKKISQDFPDKNNSLCFITAFFDFGLVNIAILSNINHQYFNSISNYFTNHATFLKSDASYITEATIIERAKAMIKVHLFTLLILSMIFVTSSVGAVIPSKEIKTKDVQAIEENLLNGLTSENYGLRTSTAYFLGEYKSSKSVVPLMKMLHSEKDESGRILAALALIKIGDSRGVYAVKQAAKFDDSKRVQRLCKIFYNAYLHGEVN